MKRTPTSRTASSSQLRIVFKWFEVHKWKPTEDVLEPGSKAKTSSFLHLSKSIILPLIHKVVNDWIEDGAGHPEEIHVEKEKLTREKTGNSPDFLLPWNFTHSIVVRNPDSRKKQWYGNHTNMKIATTSASIFDA